ncbi:MAG: FRG domain-containing protein [Clostridia bacterium]|nr:FRG domain-containing protein [Clostridia bacterium]
MSKTEEKSNSVDVKLLDEYCSRLVDEKICITDNYDIMKSIDVFIEGNAHLSRNQIEKKVIKSGGINYYCYHSLTSKKKVVYIYNLSDYLKVILEEDCAKNTKQLYRGHGNWMFDMIPGIYRKENRNILMHESQYIHEMIASYPNFFSECKAALDYLVVLQHYSFPTRLLDFTENPLVALYMACAGEQKEFGDIMKIDVEMSDFKYYDSDSISILSNMAFADDVFDVSDYPFLDYYHAYGDETVDEERKKPYNDLIEQFNKREDVSRFLHLIQGEKPYFSPRIKPNHLDGAVLWVKAKQDFQRIVNQNGVFAIFGIKRKKQQMIDFPYQKYNTLHILIPPQSKENILYELDKVHINQATLYCDMDRIATFHTEKYRKGDN